MFIYLEHLNNVEAYRKQVGGSTLLFRKTDRELQFKGFKTELRLADGMHEYWVWCGGQDRESTGLCVLFLYFDRWTAEYALLHSRKLVEDV